MAKRKRSPPSLDASDSKDTVDRVLKNQKRHCDHRIFAAQKSLVAALRLGASFERQKYSRRKKTAQSKGDEKGQSRLEAEYGVLKSLNIQQVADQHLRKTVGKIKSLKDHEALREYIEGLRKGSGDAATLNVLARLYKVTAVKQAIDEAVDDLKAIVGAEEGKAVQNGAATEMQRTRKSQRTEDKDTEMQDLDDDSEDPFSTFNSRIAAPSSGEEDSEDSVSDDERPPSIGDSESEHDPEDDLDAESESEPESFEGFSEEDIEGMDAHIDHRLLPGSDQSDSDADMDASSGEAVERATKSKAKASIDAKPNSSAFIPALSHGNYLPGSESEASDIDEAPRKNRRGQRARQKLAELKHGAKAKHLEKQERNQGWDPKRGAVSNDRRGKGGKPSGRGPHQSGGNTEPLGSKEKKGGGVKRDDKGELHPSWQAAKLAKEKKQIKIDVRAPAGQGKKVIFD